MAEKMQQNEPVLPTPALKQQMLKTKKKHYKETHAVRNRSTILKQIGCC